MVFGHLLICNLILSEIPETAYVSTFWTNWKQLPFRIILIAWKQIGIISKLLIQWILNESASKCKIAARTTRCSGQWVCADPIVFVSPDIVQFIIKPENCFYYSFQIIILIVIGLNLKWFSDGFRKWVRFFAAFLITKNLIFLFSLDFVIIGFMFISEITKFSIKKNQHNQSIIKTSKPLVAHTSDQVYYWNRLAISFNKLVFSLLSMMRWTKLKSSENECTHRMSNSYALVENRFNGRMDRRTRYRFYVIRMNNNWIEKTKYQVH